MKYKVWVPDEEPEKDAVEFEATTAENAVQLWAEWYDEGREEYQLYNGEALVHVRSEDGALSAFEVCGSYEIEYFIEEVEVCP